MREPAPDCRLPNADLPAEHREGLYGLVMDACGLAALGLFVASAILWCGGLS
jgi:hypothetical protein